MSFSEVWNKLLPIAGISAASCAILKSAEAGHAWQAALSSLFLLYVVALDNVKNEMNIMVGG